MDIKDQHILEEWQHIVDIMAGLVDVPSAIITRFAPPLVEVFKASHTEENPYSEGQKVEMSNHYCEEIFRTGRKLLIKNAKDDPKWCKAPEIDYGMVSYLGFPIRYPNGEIFGTICVIDKKENKYSLQVQELIARFRNLVEVQLTLILKNAELEEKKQEIQTLRGIIPICASCKNIRNDDGYWEQVESYIKRRSEADFTHCICPECARKLYPEFVK